MLWLWSDLKSPSCISNNVIKPSHTHPAGFIVSWVGTLVVGKSKMIFEKTHSLGIRYQRAAWAYALFWMAAFGYLTLVYGAKFEAQKSGTTKKWMLSITFAKLQAVLVNQPIMLAVVPCCGGSVVAVQKCLDKYTGGITKKFVFKKIKKRFFKYFKVCC